MKIGDLP